MKDYFLISVSTTHLYGHYRAIIQHNDTGERYNATFTDSRLYDRYKHFDSEIEREQAKEQIIKLVLIKNDIT